MKRMRVFAGPNGSGKTTLVSQFIENGLINPNRHRSLLQYPHYT